MNRKHLSVPYIVWIICGTLIPLGMMFFYGFTAKDGSFTFDNILAIGLPGHAKALWQSLELSLISTVICFVLAYPLGLILRSSRLGRKSFTLFVFILPMWMNFLLRTMAWQVLLEKGGVINSILVNLGLNRLRLINTKGAIVMGMVYDFLPFMIIQIHTAIAKLDPNLLVAAHDLGANKVKSFLKVTLPLSVPGIISGITLVFLPAVSSFVIPKMLGGGDYVLIGNLIETHMLVIGDWNYGSAISLIMALIIIAAMWATKKLDRSAQED